MRALALLLAGAWLIFAVLTTAQDVPVRVRLQHPWHRAPGTDVRAAHLLEMLEAAHAVWPRRSADLISAVWSTQEGVARRLGGADASALGDVARKAHAQQLYGAVEALLEAHLNKQEQRTASAVRDAMDEWRMAVAQHAYAPRVEAFYQLYNTSRELKSAAPTACSSWVHYAGNAYCTADELREAVAADRKHGHGAGAAWRPELLRIDHVVAPHVHAGVDAVRTAVLYADPFDASTGALHAALLTLANEPGSVPLRYVLRWRPTPAAASNEGQAPAAAPGYLGGYAATLHLKKVDYLVIDDRHLDVVHNTSIFRDAIAPTERAARLETRTWLERHLGSRNRLETGAAAQDAVAAQRALQDQDVALLGLAAACAVLQSKEPLRALEQLTSEFPLHAASLASYARRQHRRYARVTDAILSLQEEMVQEGVSQVWLNGQLVRGDEFNMLSLAPRIREERELVYALSDPAVGLTPQAAILLLSNEAVGTAFQQGEASEALLVDASDRPERGAVLAYLNDLEDGSYEYWPSELRSLLAPRWPTSFPPLARNLFNLVLLPDLRRSDALHQLGAALGKHVMGYPLRWAVAPLLDRQDAASETLAQVLWHALDLLPRRAVAELLHELADAPDGPSRPREARAALAGALRVHSEHPLDAEVQRFLDDGTTTPAHTARLEQTYKYLRRLHVARPEAAAGVAFLNGQELAMDDDLLRYAVRAVNTQLGQLLEPLYYGMITEDMDVSTFYYDLPTTVPRRSTLATALRGGTSGGVERTVTDLPAALRAAEEAAVDAGTERGEAVAALRSFMYASPDATPLVSLRVVGDLDSAAGREMVTHALEALDQHRFDLASDASFRLGFVHVPDSSRAAPDRALSEFLFAAQRASRLSALKCGELLDALGAPDGAGAALRALAAKHAIPLQSEEAAARFWRAAGPAFAREMGGARGVVLLVNGQALWPLDRIPLDADEVGAAAAAEHTAHMGVLSEILELDTTERETRALAMEIMATVLNRAFAPRGERGAYAPSAPRTAAVEQLQQSKAAFALGDEDASVRFTVLLDPLARVAPEWTATVRALASLHGVRVAVVMNPGPHGRGLPLQRFTRSEVRVRPEFGADGAEVPPGVTFEALPPQAVLTMQLEAPRGMVTMAHDAVYDLDNVRLADVTHEAGVEAAYMVKHVLIEGHALPLRGSTPRGLQLLLETDDGSEQLDTIVMENLGYFQFKAHPGRWNLRVREGRSDQLYTMQSTGSHGWHSPPLSVTGPGLALDTLLGQTVYPRFAKRPGQEQAELIEDAEHMRTGSGGGKATGSQFGNALRRGAESMLRSSGVLRRRTHADINIFTLASGHLYERMTYIMILSVLRHTKSSVKFWFVENFLSPSFKAFIPHLAKEYGFSYELVTYAWPHWLREQTEKQRMIWAYKILFLDVLFPLDLDRVIFVDADQIVRHDLQELVDIDLHGAPYGYPPMGDDAEDMEGFRFWKQGYWARYLRGRPYHISALYVVDLQRFRYMAAGDVLRRQYQQLSVDPQSLANLDQDLPNHLQFFLPIHTLDKTWLWCETWCSRSWLPQAKTIDLCSNPKTKEPKLDRARRQIPEWNQLDAEVGRLAKRLAEQAQLTAVAESKDAQQPQAGQPPPATHDEL